MLGDELRKFFLELETVKKGSEQWRAVVLLALAKSCIWKNFLADKHSSCISSVQKLKIFAGTYFRAFRNFCVNLFLRIESKSNILGRGQN